MAAAFSELAVVGGPRKALGMGRCWAAQRAILMTSGPTGTSPLTRMLQRIEPIRPRAEWRESMLYRSSTKRRSPDEPELCRRLQAGVPLLLVERTKLAAAIMAVARLKGDFQLRSGARSAEYFDKYRFESRPALLRAVAQQLLPLVPPSTEILAGLELGGVPIATALSLETNLPVTFVRKTAKSYGTCRIAEGADIEGRQVLVVEDVVTSGGQIVTSTQELRELGAIIACALCVIDREGDGPRALSEIGVTLQALFTKSQLESAAELSR